MASNQPLRVGSFWVTKTEHMFPDVSNLFTVTLHYQCSEAEFCRPTFDMRDTEVFCHKLELNFIWDGQAGSEFGKRVITSGDVGMHIEKPACGSNGIHLEGVFVHEDAFRF